VIFFVAAMKKAGYKVEYVDEYATKEKTYEKEFEKLDGQSYTLRKFK
jgi:hypothetical protein